MAAIVGVMVVVLTTAAAPVSVRSKADCWVFGGSERNAVGADFVGDEGRSRAGREEEGCSQEGEDRVREHGKGKLLDVDLRCRCLVVVMK